MKKEAQIIMLPTDDANAPLMHHTPKNTLVESRLWKYSIHNKYQHLYAVTDEEIKAGEWYMYINLQGVPMFPLQYKNKNKPDDLDKKIIAVTDESLEIITRNADGLGNDLHQPLPTFKQSFLEEYCSKGGIDKVKVEYDYCKTKDGLKEWIDCSKLKINPDNTINIFLIKDSWNREEVIKLLRESHSEAYCEDGKLKGKSPVELSNWIKENL